MTITYNPNTGQMYAVRGGETVAEGVLPVKLTLEELLNTMIFKINNGELNYADQKDS